ncbi:hypothetical protein [Bosea sp. BK604]|uniref:hypothetical protein n=1 Tax=Bosea sp. BK604 TaxID=2512180 RepID=UPI00104575DF|nr:hypothetical protein [Bosea sp. BK604]
MTRIAPRPHRDGPRMLRSLALASALSLASFTANPATASPAQEQPVPVDPPRLAQAPEPLCFCWSDGRKIAEGASACIRTNQGRRLANCGRVINMMSWEVTENPCPES